MDKIYIVRYWLRDIKTKDIFSFVSCHFASLAAAEDWLDENYRQALFNPHFAGDRVFVRAEIREYTSTVVSYHNYEN